MKSSVQLQAIKAAVVRQKGGPFELETLQLDGPRPPGRIDAALIATTTWPSKLAPTCYVCGPTSFVESATGFLSVSGNRPDKIRTERFGPTGDRK